MNIQLMERTTKLSESDVKVLENLLQTYSLTDRQKAALQFKLALAQDMFKLVDPSYKTAMNKGLPMFAYCTISVDEKHKFQFRDTLRIGLDDKSKFVKSSTSGGIMWMFNPFMTEREQRDAKHNSMLRWKQSPVPPIPNIVKDFIKRNKSKFESFKLVWEATNWEDVPVDPVLLGVCGENEFLIYEWELSPQESEFFK